MSQVIEANDSTFETEVLQSSDPVLVDFTATWCAPCKKLAPIVDEIATEYAGRLKVVKVDIDGARQTAAKFNVMSVPTVLLIKDGQVRDQFMGVAAKSAIADKIQKVL